MNSFTSWEDAAKHPISASLAASVVAGVGGAIIAYERFADRNVALACACGALIAVIAFAGVYKKAQGVRSAAGQPKDDHPRQQANGVSTVASVSWFDAALIVVAFALVVTAAVFSAWSLLVPAAIFAGLSAALIAVRHSARRRVR